VLSYGTPHDPYFKVPDHYLDLYRDRELPLRENVPETLLLSSSRKLNREQAAQNQKGYYAHITALDDQFGRILAALERTGQLDRTVIVYTSDHGDMLGSQGFCNKQLPYAESVDVPLLVYYPGKAVPGVRDEVISLVDLPVSLMKLAGMEFESRTDGQDLHRLFTDPEARGLEEAYILDLVPCHQAYARGGTEWHGIKTRTHTFARNFDGSFCVLFDDAKDPFQKHNLAGEDSQLQGQMEERLVQTAARYGEFLPWERYIRKYGYRDAWNQSQAYFRLPLLD
jgi:arylsulfatase A-like enzyme